MERQEPKRAAPAQPNNDLHAPPRFLLWLIIGLFLLAIIGGITGLVVFRNVLRPGQQQRIVEAVPFMKIFLDRPDPNMTVPTVQAPTGEGMTADDLLSEDFFSTTPEATEPAAAATAALTPTSVSLAPTTAPTLAPTSTPTMTPTDEPTLAPTIAPTEQTASLSLPNLGGVSVAQAAGEEQSVPVVDDTANLSVAADIPRFAHLSGFTVVQQTWNNCGPANITMALSYYGWQQDQTFAASYLKPDREDKNVSPSEMVAFVNEQSQVRAVTRIGGDMELLKEFIAAGFPVIIETGYAPEGNDWFGHYQTVVGYDDNGRDFYIFDSYLGTGENGAGMAEPYDEFDSHWQQFNRIFIVIYDPSREAEVTAILGERADVTFAAEHAYTVAQSEARANPQNQFAWFNMGTALTKLGRYADAAPAFDRATQIGLHYRMLWYQFGPFEAYFNVGRYDDVLSLATSTLNTSRDYVEESYYWQGRAYEAQGLQQQAADSFRRALLHNPRYAAAQQALAALNT
jgi:hypothetical protein